MFSVCYACWSPAGRYPPVKWNILVSMLKENSLKIVCRLVTRRVFVHSTEPRLTSAGSWDLVPNCITFSNTFYVTFANKISKHTKCDIKVPRLRLWKAENGLDLNFAAIPFEVVTLCSDTLLPAPRLVLERSLEVALCKRVKQNLRFALDLLHGVKTATLKLELHLGE